MRNPDTVVGDRQHGERTLSMGFELDFPARIRVLRRVGEQVADALHEPCTVAIDTKRRVAHADDDLVPLLAHERLCAFERFGDYVGEIDGPALQLDSPLRDARDVEQIVYEPRQL